MATERDGGRDWKELYAAKRGGRAPSGQVLDHFLNPRNAGRIEDPDGVGSVGDPDCGESLEVTLRFEGDVIADARFQVRGCPGATAAASAVTCLAKGKHFRDALLLTGEEVEEFLEGAGQEKGNCPFLAVHALRAAIQDAVLMKSLLEHGVVASREEYARLRAGAACRQAPGTACDGSCGSEGGEPRR